MMTFIKGFLDTISSRVRSPSTASLGNGGNPRSRRATAIPSRSDICSAEARSPAGKTVYASDNAHRICFVICSSSSTTNSLGNAGSVFVDKVIDQLSNFVYCTQQPDTESTECDCTRKVIVLAEDSMSESR